MFSLFKNIKLESWVDYLFAISGIVLILSLVATFSGNILSKYICAISVGIVLFSIAGKKAHYKYRDKNISGNSNVWLSGWKHGFISDLLASIGILIVIVALYMSYCKYYYL